MVRLHRCIETISRWNAFLKRYCTYTIKNGGLALGRQRTGRAALSNQNRALRVVQEMSVNTH